MRKSESLIRVAYPSHLSESLVVVACRCRLSESLFRVAFPSRLSEFRRRQVRGRSVRQQEPHPSRSFESLFELPVSSQIRVIVVGPSESRRIRVKSYPSHRHIRVTSYLSRHIRVVVSGSSYPSRARTGPATAPQSRAAARRWRPVAAAVTGGARRVCVCGGGWSGQGRCG